MIGIFFVYLVAQVLILLNKQKWAYTLLFLNLFFTGAMLYYHATSSLNIQL